APAAMRRCRRPFRRTDPRPQGDPCPCGLTILRGGKRMHIAVIGTRTPSKLDYEFVKLLCAHLATLQHLVRTGGAVGIDAAAIAGVNMVDHDYVWIYEPWPHFADGVASELNARIRLRPEWLETVGKYHPNPYALSSGGRKLMARNYGIIAWPNRVDLVIARSEERRVGKEGAA